MSSQAQTPVYPSPEVNPNQCRAPSSKTNPSPPSEAHPEPNSSELLDKAASAADNPGPSDTAVASTTAVNLKRSREEDAAEGQEAGTTDGAPSAKRRVKATHDLIYRILVPSRHIGKVIGKSGHRIQKIREDTKATIKIADAISRQEDRVIIISSKDSDGTFSDAENALHQIVSLILQEDDGDAEASKVGAGHVAPNTVRILIAGCQAGGVIGTSGQNIVNLRITSGASITILSPNQLPPCASAHETDRIVQMSGEIPAVLRAVVEIGCQLRDHPPKQVISVSPKIKTGFHRQSQQYVDPNSADYATMDIMVPENLVGGLIGRFGANISRIRNESGANIKVHGGRGEQTQRQIHLGGSARQVALAKLRVDEYVYAELMRQAGGQVPQAAAGQYQQYPSQPPVPEMPTNLYQGYGHPHTLYATSNQEGGMMGTFPQMYGSTATNQAPPPPPHPYYGHQSYPAPQL
ncbi:poly(rc)-binding protein 4 [Phtheirospermum japonicum]|uniref:Poly(Rc)-binding protein 4 n=1 Tax=Phtheirospermum japonicum TaxID=374723 RepID=A0A830DF12_9LAMI|nr:poly(rc)-binding protein 4 [Phtheirospermum japonicum]